MEHIFNRVIVLVNDLEKMEILLEKGVVFANGHNAFLEVLFVHEVPLFEIPDYFLSEEKIAEGLISKDKIHQEIEEVLKGLEIEKEPAILVYENDTVDRLLTLLKDTKETLVVTAYHTSLSAKLVEETPYAFWFIKEDERDYNNIALPMELEDEFEKCIKLTQHLFPKGEITLLHDYRSMSAALMVSQDYMGGTPMPTQVDVELDQLFREKQLKIFNEYMEKYAVEGVFFEGEGVMYEDIMHYIQDNDFDLTVLYRNSNELFLTSTRITELIKEVSTDILVCQD